MLKNMNKAILIAGLLLAVETHAALSIDRIRIIYPENKDAITLSVENKSKKKPYLAQTWLENDKFEKIASPLIVLPPIQRVDPENKTQVKIKKLPDALNLPKDRESIFYFNIREIPPASDNANTLQIALQTRIKLFYRPTTLQKEVGDKNLWSNLKLEKRGESFILINPTPYFITVSALKVDEVLFSKNNYEPVMVYPKSSDNLGVKVSKIPSSIIVSYINDYGGVSNIDFSCKNDVCHVK
ncbi:fimbria/pilus periplasmic chaperone [Klebsiella oxytoca]|uniref:fimbria/pilus periplasmic chaperone n=1 Tax=Klebsiella oxytoca TaxID=571 RepID=UPI00224551DA|nr:fimbria/pilus periplasmic chaperone [Klebsiella oxytoca]MCW9445973.1 fimbria/pilus periplasmic chaperone [Klebsiella oxytoca]